MSQTRVLVLLAGAALSIGAPALAQNANLDKDRAYAAELVNDAGSRASLLQGGGGGAGRDAKGFYITDGTGNNTLYIGGAAQFRYQHNFRDETDGQGQNEDNDFTHGFSHRNVRLWWFGSVWSKDLTYMVKANLASTRTANAGFAGFDGDNSGVIGDDATDVLPNASNWDNTEGQDASAAFEDVWGNYAWDNGVSVKWGQFKLPIFREESINSEHLLGLDRSNNNDVFNQGYSQGVMITYTSDSFRMNAAFSDGAGYAAAANHEVLADRTPALADEYVVIEENDSVNGTGNSTFDAGNEADFAVTLRGDVKFAGNDWSRFDDFTSFKNQDFAGYVGAAFHYQDGGATGASTADVEVWHLTLDTQMEGAGWNVFAAFMASNIEMPTDTFSDLDGNLINDVPNSFDTTNYGVVLQGGLFVSDQAELFARWDATFWDDNYVEDEFTPDLDADGTLDDPGFQNEEVDNNHFLTIGANYYISPESHAVKFTAQATWALNATDTKVGIDANPDANTVTQDPIFAANNDSAFDNNSMLGSIEDGEITLGFQMQVMW